MLMRRHPLHLIYASSVRTCAIRMRDRSGPVMVYSPVEAMPGMGFLACFVFAGTVPQPFSAVTDGRHNGGNPEEGNSFGKR